MACSELLSLTQDAKYFGCCGLDGKLRVWETATGTLKQEFTPNLHLSSPCTCLTWISVSRNPSPRKSQKRKSHNNSFENEDCMDIAVLGTASGSILLYSLATASIQTQLDQGHTARVNHLSWSTGTSLFSCSDDQHIIEWDVRNKQIQSKWKAGKERVSCILVLPDGKSLLSAHRTISWWDLKTREVIKTFTGHASEVNTMMLALKASVAGENYFISVGEDDRYLNAWMLNSNTKDKSCIASFVMEDSARCVSLTNGSPAAPTTMAAVTRSGVVHIYKHQLNGKCLKPLKPKVTLMIALDTGQETSATVTPIPVVAAQLGQDASILIAYGHGAMLSFERIGTDYKEKVVCLSRKDSRHSSSTSSDAVSKVRVPETSNGVEYTTGFTSNIGVGVKRRAQKKGVSEVPMEERLENLTLNKLEVGAQTPRGNSMAQLLMQGLHSKDKRLLHHVLIRRDQELITNTVAQLPVQVISPLIRELTLLLNQGKNHMRCSIAVNWLKCVISTHAGHLLAMPDLADSMSGILGMAELRLQVLAPLSRLRGRLDLLVDQLDTCSKRAQTQDLDQSLLVYQDPDSSDEESAMDEDAVVGSESDHWDEQSSLDDMTDGEVPVYDVDMSD